MHAHSELSDGTGSPYEAYETARDAGLNYFALTDHGELLAIWPWERKWDKLVDAANENNVEGSFVSLWGFEWSNPFLVFRGSDHANQLILRKKRSKKCKYSALVFCFNFNMLHKLIFDKIDIT